MKIAVEARYLLAREKTGVEHYTASLLNALTTNGGAHEFILVVDHAPDDGAPIWTRPNVEVRILAPRRIWLKHHFGRVTRDADIALFPGSIVPWTRPWKCVPIVYDLAWYDFPQFYPQRELRIYRKVYPWGLARADLIVAISEHTRRDLQRVYGVASERVVIVPPGVDRAFSPPADAGAQVKARWGLQPGYVLAVGIDRPRKNPDGLLRAYAAAVQQGLDAPLVIAGAVTHLGGRLKRLEHELGLGGRTVWLGYVEQAALPALYAAAGVFVLPSWYEGFGMPVLEAMACGCPVVCANTAALPEAAGDAAALVNPADSDTIAAALLMVLRDGDRRAALRAAGFEQVRRFDWGRSAQTLLAALESLAR